MSGRTLCPITNPVRLERGTLARSRFAAPGPLCRVRTRHARSAVIAVPSLIFNADQTVAFLDSVAHASAAQHFIKLVWTDYTDSTVLNIIYSIPGLGRPGIVEVDPGDVNKVLARAQSESARLQEEFCVAMSRGASRVARFMTAQQEIRRYNLEAVQSVYHDAAQLNEAMRGEARRAIARLALIQASATITVKTAALFAGGLPAFLIGTGYDVSLDVIKHWDSAPDAMLAGAASTAWTEKRNDLVKDAAANMANIYRDEASAPGHKVAWLRKRLSAMQEELEHQASAERLRKFAKDGRRLARAEAAVSRARWGMRAMSAVKFGFFAWEMVKVARETDETFHDAGYDSSLSAIRDAL